MTDGPLGAYTGRGCDRAVSGPWEVAFPLATAA